MKKKVCAVLLGTALTCHVPLVYGAVQDYQAVTEADKEDNKIFQAFSTEDGSGNSVNVAAIQDTVYVAAKNAGIYSKPGESSEKMGTLHWAIHWREVQSVIMDGAKYPVK